MTHTTALARSAGALYLIVAVAGGFSELFVRSTLSVPGDAAATLSNIAAHAGLFRLGFIADVVDVTCFLGVGLILYALLRQVQPTVALAMLLINAVSVAIQAVNTLNHLGALLAVTLPAYTSAAGPQAAQSLVALFLELHRQGYLVAQIFFGGYLLPLGYLVYRSSYFPRVLGGVLILGSAGYLAQVVAAYLSPDSTSAIGLYFGLLGGLAETAFLVWLLVIGAGSRPASLGSKTFDRARGALA